MAAETAVRFQKEKGKDTLQAETWQAESVARWAPAIEEGPINPTYLPTGEGSVLKYLGVAHKQHR